MGVFFFFYSYRWFDCQLLSRDFRRSERKEEGVIFYICNYQNPRQSSDDEGAREKKSSPKVAGSSGLDGYLWSPSSGEHLIHTFRFSRSFFPTSTDKTMHILLMDQKKTFFSLIFFTFPLYIPAVGSCANCRRRVLIKSKGKRRRRNLR